MPTELIVLNVIENTLPLVAALAGSILAVAFRRRLGRAATWCAVLGFGLLTVDRLISFLFPLLLSSDRSNLVYIVVPLFLTDLASVPLLVFAVFLGRRARQAAAVDAGTITVGSEQPFDRQPFGR